MPVTGGKNIEPSSVAMSTARPAGSPSAGTISSTMRAEQRRVLHGLVTGPVMQGEPGQRGLVGEPADPPHPARTHRPQPPVGHRHQQHRPSHLADQGTGVVASPSALGDALGERGLGLLHGSSPVVSLVVSLS